MLNEDSCLSLAQANYDALLNISYMTSGYQSERVPNAQGCILGFSKVQEHTVASCSTNSLRSWQGTMGEAAETLSLLRGPVIEAHHDCAPCPEGFLAKLTDNFGSDIQKYGLCSGYDHIRGCDVAVPRMLFRYDEFWGDIPMSVGCSAAPTVLDAFLGGVCELVEHKVISDWCLGYVNPKQVLDISLIPEIQSLIEGIRRGQNGRTTKVLYLGQYFGIHVCASWSHDHIKHSLAGNLGFVMASAADTSAMKACERAVFELVQFEVGLDIAKYKSVHNPENLTKVDNYYLELAKTNPSKEMIFASHLADEASDLSKMFHDKVSIDSNIIYNEICKAMKSSGYQLLSVTLHNQHGLAVVKCISDIHFPKQNIFGCFIS